MFKFALLSALVCVAVAAPMPGYLGGYAVPAATSYSSRVDVHSPVIKTYAAPIYSKTLVAAPAVSYHSAPLVSGYSLGHGLGHGLSYAGYGYGGGHDFGLGHGYDLGYGSGHEYGLGHGYGLGHSLGYGYGHGW